MFTLVKATSSPPITSSFSLSFFKSRLDSYIDVQIDDGDNDNKGQASSDDLIYPQTVRGA